MQRLAPWLVALIAVAVCGGLLVRDHSRQLENASLRATVADLTAAQDHQKEAMKALLAKDEAARLEAQKARQQAADNAKARPGFSHPIDSNAMRNDPAFAALWRRMQLRVLYQEYGDAFSKLKLSPDQLAKLKDLMIDRVAAGLDARDAASASGLSNAESAQAFTQARDEVTAEMTALVGGDVIGQINSAGQVFVMRWNVQNLAGLDLTAAGVPLSSDQTSALAEIYADFQIPDRLKRTPDLGKLFGAPADPITGLTPLNQAMLDQAAQVLSSAQLPIFRQSLIDENQQQAFIQRQQAAAQAGK
jgi:hypothetical protein